MASTLPLEKTNLSDFDVGHYVEPNNYFQIFFLFGAAGMASKRFVAVLIFLGFVLPAWGEEHYTRIPMYLKSAKTYYVTARVAGAEPAEFMVDTGSSYTTINNDTLDKLDSTGETRYLRDLVAVLANGHEVRVPLYLVSKLVLSKNCMLHNVEVAVFPSRTRQILGLSALTKTSPFQFSVDPPELRLSNCRMTEHSELTAQSS